ncbi:hypothetical protein FACS189454_02600 [Planctomycetales bacterium]|nr:hypothetical protein FACS189454_02600 [Planctomycetales bacterium]
MDVAAMGTIYDIFNTIIALFVVLVILKIVAYPVLHPNEPIENLLKKLVISGTKWGIIIYGAHFILMRFIIPLIGQLIRQIELFGGSGVSL